MLKQTICCFLFLILLATHIHAHCQVPCGIYNDKARVEEIKEHVTTIEKAMNQISALSGNEEKNYNQIVRWVHTKEEHANEIQSIVQKYFMTQRIKPAAPESEAYSKYVQETTLLHQILVHAMKAKQTTDTVHTTALKSKLSQFSDSYFEK